MTWISIEDDLPEETQAYGCTTDDVYVKNSNSGFEDTGFLAHTTTGSKWFTKCGKFELQNITHWKYI